MLETKRLILRPWQEEDAESLYEYAKDPDVGPAAGWPPHTDVENSREIILNVLSSPETYAVCLKYGKPVGSVGLKLKAYTDMTDRDDECELGYWIGKPFWGQGLIPEAARELLRYAFEDLNMRAVWCGYYEGNEKSHRVQQKLGFVYHHTTENLDVPLMGEKRTGHASVLTRHHWKQLK
ncbi:MAG: GNAT family N-acetyltransferase [Oscillospiraceae bacterium]|nr:GNAT family N-acetyltransferase [Oscillospiraceae bacterium]